MAARYQGRMSVKPCALPLMQVEDNQISITDPADTGGSKREPKAFSYDFAYDWTSTQEGVHRDLGAPIVEKALQGYNGKYDLRIPPTNKSSKLDLCSI